MASLRGKNLWQLVLLILAMKQMVWLGEAGRPFFGYGDEDRMEYPPRMNGGYEFRCNSGPVLDEVPLPPYSECGNVRKAASFKYMRARQMVYYCVAGVPPGGVYAGYHNPPPYPQQPRPRDTRSGPYALPGGPEDHAPPQMHDFYPPPSLYRPHQGQYERPYGIGPAEGRGSGRVVGTSRPTKTFPPRPSVAGEGGGRRPPSPDQYIREDQAGKSGTPIRFGSHPPSPVYGGADGVGPAAGGAKPKNGPNSTSPVLFVEPSSSTSANFTTTTPSTRTQTRAYSPYMMYGMRLIQ